MYAKFDASSFSQSRDFTGDAKFKMGHVTLTIPVLRVICPPYAGRHNLVIFVYASCSGRHAVGQGNVHILQHYNMVARTASIDKNVEIMLLSSVNLSELLAF